MDTPPKNSRDILREKYSPEQRKFEDLTRPDLAHYFFEILEKHLLQSGVGNLRSGNLRVLEVGSGNAEFLKYAKKEGVNIVGVGHTTSRSYQIVSSNCPAIPVTISRRVIFEV